MEKMIVGGALGIIIALLLNMLKWKSNYRYTHKKFHHHLS
jgi:hypothetical protein